MDFNEKIKNENNVGKWNGWYTRLPDVPSAFVYGQTVTYEKAANFLSDCKEIEDWGCGAGGFMMYRPDAIGVDGSETKFAQKQLTDLRTYTSDCEAIHIRHVFEHNYAWKEILYNAMKSARKKLSLTMFIPFTDGETTEIAHNKIHGVDVPDLLISRKEFFDIVNEFSPKSIEIELLNTPTGYGREEIIFITK